jgi:hypothetical protein
MKHLLIRVAIYIPIISFFWWIFVPSFFEPMALRGGIIQQIPAYVVYYGITYGMWVAAYELCYRAARYARKAKAAPVQETQRLEPLDARPTAVLEVRK